MCNDVPNDVLSREFGVDRSVAAFEMHAKF